MAAINSGQSAAIGSSSSRAMHIFHTRRQYSYLSTVIARYLPKVISVCGRNRKYSTVWLSWLQPRRSGGLTWIHPTALPFSKIKIPHLSKGKPNILDDSQDQFEEKEKIRSKTKKSSNSTMHTYRGFRCWKHPSAFRMPLPRPSSPDMILHVLHSFITASTTRNTTHASTTTTIPRSSSADIEEVWLTEKLKLLLPLQVHLGREPSFEEMSCWLWRRRPTITKVAFSTKAGCL